MAQYIAPFLTGKDVRSVSVYGVNVDGFGQISIGNTSFDIAAFGALDAFRWEGDRGLEEITALDAFTKTFLPTVADFSITLGEIMRRDVPPVLHYIATNYDYVQVGIGIGGTGEGFSAIPNYYYAVYAAIASDSFEINVGKSAATMMVKPCGYYLYNGYTGNVTSVQGASLNPNILLRPH